MQKAIGFQDLTTALRSGFACLETVVKDLLEENHNQRLKIVTLEEENQELKDQVNELTLLLKELTTKGNQLP